MVESFTNKIKDIFNSQKKQIWEIKNKIEDYLILKDKKLNIEIPNDLMLHLGFNANCNCRCKFCSQGDQRYIKKELIDQKLLYEYLLPLYPKTKLMLTAQGEITCVPEGYEYLKWIDDNYPQMNVEVDTNGIAFNEKWQDLAVKNLMKVHFSVNAISNETFLRTVWGDVGGEQVFEKVQHNIKQYIQKLKNKGLEAFMPSVSCVLNSSNYHEIIQFTEMVLGWGIYKIFFLYDTNEHNIRTGNIKDKQAFIRSLRILIELEKLLKNRVQICFRTLMPYDDISLIEKEVDSMSNEELQIKYTNIYELSEGLNYELMFKKANQLRVKNGKYEISKKEESIRYSDYIDGVEVCVEPWKYLRIRANGYMSVCCMRGYGSNFKFQDFVKNNRIDWDEVFNGLFYKRLRKNFKSGCYDGCMHNCPGIPKSIILSKKKRV